MVVAEGRTEGSHASDRPLGVRVTSSKFCNELVEGGFGTCGT